MSIIDSSVKNFNPVKDLIKLGPLTEAQKELLIEVCGFENVVTSPVAKLRHFVDVQSKASAVKKGK